MTFTSQHDSNENTDHMTPLITLFLDFDGVLHPQGATTDRLFERAGLLQVCLQQTENVEVVISSSWAEYYPLEKMRNFFEDEQPHLHRLIVGCTLQKGKPKVDFGDMPLRESQCRNWLIANQREPHRWLAIEDDLLNFAAREHVVFTDPKHGFMTRDAELLLLAVGRLRVSCWATTSTRCVEFHRFVTRGGCGRKLGLPGGSSCIRTKIGFEPLSSTSSWANASDPPSVNWGIQQRIH